MTDKMAAFTDQVVQALENARFDANMTVNELLRRSGLKRSSYFRKMRGDTELTTGDIDRLARALGRDPMLVLAEAAEQAQVQRSIDNILGMAAKRGDMEAARMLISQADYVTAEILYGSDECAIARELNVMP